MMNQTKIISFSPLTAPLPGWCSMMVTKNEENHWKSSLPELWNIMVIGQQLKLFWMAAMFENECLQFVTPNRGTLL